MALAPVNTAISLLIRDGTGVNNRNLLILSNRARLGSWSGHLMKTLDLVLELNLLNNLLSRDQGGLAGFGSRDSGQIMSMVMILLLIV